jgi:hypothetical protein
VKKSGLPRLFLGIAGWTRKATLHSRNENASGITHYERDTRAGSLPCTGSRWLYQCSDLRHART